MDKDKLKVIIQNIETLLECLKLEINSDYNTHKSPKYEEVASYINDYDEIFYDGDDE